MNLEDEFVTHREIDLFDLALIKKYGSKCGMIDFGSIEITIIELAIDKSDAYKIAFRKITIGKCAAFKFFEVECFQTIADVVVVLVKEVLGHFVRLEVRGWKLEVCRQILENGVLYSKICLLTSYKLLIFLSFGYLTL